MDYSMPLVADYRNVSSLNTAFLSLLRNRVAGAPWRELLPEPLRDPVEALTDLQLERLAACPFLLVSFRENDPDYWRGLVDDEPTADLLHESPQPAPERIAASGLAFLWQLARRSPYSVKLVSGGDAAFCERLAGITIVRLLSRASGRSDIALPRFVGEPNAWAKLLGPGISSMPRVRVAAQLSVLQAMLTRSAAAPRERLRAAACASPVPVARVSGKPGRR